MADYYLLEDGTSKYIVEGGGGFYLLENSSITPAVGAVTAAGLAPTLDKAKTVTPGVGLTTFGGLSPSALDDKQVGPATGLVSVAGLAPTVIPFLSLTVTPGVGLIFATRQVSWAADASDVTADSDVATADGFSIDATFIPSVLRYLAVHPSVGLIFAARVILWTADASDITADSDTALADGSVIDPDFHPTILTTSSLVGRRGRTRHYYSDVHTTPITAPYVPEPWTNPPELRLPQEVAELHAALDRERAQALTVAVLAKAKRRAQNRRALEMLLMDE